MITEMITGLIKKLTSKTISKMVTDGLINSISGVEERLEKRLTRALQKNVDSAVKKVKRELLHASMLMFAFAMIILGVFMIMAKYFPAEYLLIASGTILLSVTIISK